MSLDFDYAKNTPLFEAPRGSDVYKFKGKFYALRSSISSKDVGQVKEITVDLENTEENYESQLKCPVCGWEDQNSWEISDDEGETECGRCGAVLEFIRNITIDYCTTVKSVPTIMEVNDASIYE